MFTVSKRVQNLISQMTIEEKVSQIVQVMPAFFKDGGIEDDWLTGPLNDVSTAEDFIYNAGSVINISDDAEENIKLQKKYMEKNRLHIPLLLMSDIIHGYRTAFPIPLALACAFDPKPTYNTAMVSAREAAAAGVHVTYSPMLDLSRDPRWGRVMEGPGECPYIGEVSAKAWVEGYQGTDKSELADGKHIAATLKHFVGYAMAEGGRDYDRTDICENTLKEFYLRAFKAGIDCGAALIMAAFCMYENIPCHANKKLLKTILRDEMGFEGLVISDWGGIREVANHGYSADTKEASMRAINAGVDVDLMGLSYQNYLKELVEEGLVPMENLDLAVARTLMLKEDLGLFDDPFRGASKELTDRLYLCDEHRALAYDAAVKSCVLLKNNGVLPFDKSVKKIAVIGPNAQSSVNGNWTASCRPEESVTIAEGIRKFAKHAEVKVELGCKFRERDEQLLKSAVKVAKDADIVILALGEFAKDSGECTSHTNINTYPCQIELAKAVVAANSNTAVVMMDGRPPVLGELNDIAPAILEAWFLGTEAGTAVADILFGEYNPTGRLAMSFLRNVGQAPTYYNRFNTGRPNYDDSQECCFTVGYTDCKMSPLYPFGYGLSYSTFEYSDLCVPEKMKHSTPITVSATVKNTGKVAGVEQVQLYIRDVVGSVVRPVKELKGVKQVKLNPGEQKTVEFEINEDMLKFFNDELKFVAENGEFHVMIGHDSTVSEHKSFILED